MMNPSARRNIICIAASYETGPACLQSYPPDGGRTPPIRVRAHFRDTVTIARRLTLLLAVPIAVLVALGGSEIDQLRRVERHSAFVSALQVQSLKSVGLISAKLTDIRVN